MLFGLFGIMFAFDFSTIKNKLCNKCIKKDKNMKKRHLIIFQTLLSLLLVSSFAFAAPNINDGFMSYTNTGDWGGLNVTTFGSGFDPTKPLTNVSVEEGRTNGEDYDVEELGLYINDSTLYLGIQTNFDLKDGIGSVKSGDFIFNFDEGSNAFGPDNRDADNFAFNFTVHSSGSVDFTLLGGNLTGGTPTSYTSNYGKDWEIVSAQHSQDFLGAGTFTEGNNGGEDGYSNGLYTLEAAIDLSLISDELAIIFAGYASTYDSVTMFWQPSCGNDFLAARSEFDFTPNNQTPEPATLLLFGMGLLGAGAYGRKRQKKE